MGWLRDTLGRLASGGAPRAAAEAPVPVAAPAPAPPPWRKLGNEALAKGDLAEAGSCYAQGVLLEPQDAALRLNHGFVLLEQGQFAAAAERLQQALALHRPGDGCAPEDAHFLLGRAQARLGQRAEAAASFAAALQARPEFPEALEEIVRVLDGLKRHAEAADWMARLVQLQPTNVNRLVLASQLGAAKRYAEAVEVLDRICAEESANVEAAVMRCGFLNRCDRLDAALAEADRVLAIAGPSARFLVNRAVILQRLGRSEEALANVDQGLALDPDHRDGLLNRCTILTSMLRIPEAVASAEDALRRHPEDADLHYSTGMTFLLAGDLRRGWASHEWRGRSTALEGKLLKLDQAPPWRGEDLRGRTIFLYGEQGLGDNIQFLRYVEPVADMAQSVVVMVLDALEPLVAPVLPANCRLLPQNSPLPAIDFHCSLMSLPALLGTTLETIPAHVPYVRAEPETVASWRKRMDPGALNVGIAWAGNPKHENDRNRSMALATFRAVDTEGCRFLTAQPDVRESDRPVLATWARAADFGRDLRNFADTAAYFEALDLVITVDTSVAHLAGALGRPVWILLPHGPDWRWMVEREDSPWYPTARLYRQPRRGDWAAVLERVRADLAALVAKREAGR